MPDVIGIIGSALLIFAYFLLQKGSLKGDGWGYLWMNLIAASMILYSLLFHWNTASFIIEIFWIGISIYGMWRRLKKKDDIVYKEEI
ncbi:MAG: hypothetical protein COV36_07640 [Alphaproteobacteria bacterium CG11_big_fil_rev_8_21_14_0_20_44_7]|nr:MAG: hypothetical protein COV36_07640 [Alphaproteobacteria bacterium CG11_big_fil_rev_8_21_14_0_20_44_7]